ncbi:hypothetical protein SEPCBS119000_004361 [Sporothrix epigloea]|uniref:CFEM domain-containing protein n=1 Tax=Sporothrix epigloea TaxID=1892477 RepID=A0ABP0DVF6_9PEZI
MKSRTYLTPCGRRGRLAVAASTLFFASAAALADSTTATPTQSKGTTGTTTTTGANQSGTISVVGTSLPELVTETEACAVLCYNAACLDSGCAPGDFACVCGNPNSLVVKMGICVGKDCDDSRQFDSGDWIAQVCGAYEHAVSNTADLVSASSLLVAEISSAAATATNNPVPSSETIANGSGTGTETAGAASTATTASTAAASSARLGVSGVGGGVLGLTSALVALAGGATFLAAHLL